MGALSRLIAKELSSAFGFTKKVKDIKTEPALGIVDNPKYNPAFKEVVEKLDDKEVDVELGFDDYSLTDDDVLDDIDLFDLDLDDGFRVDADGNRLLLDTDGNTMVDANGNPMLEHLDYDSEGNIIELDDFDEIDDQARLFEDANNDPWQYVDQDGDDLEFNDPRNPDLGAEMRRQIGVQPVAQQERTIATFYSPLRSALDEAPISDKGTMGKNIMAFIRKRSPKMSEGELNYTGDFLDPNRKYTREEAKDLAYQKGLTVKAVINQGRNYQGLQRQRLSYKDYMEMDDGYVEILLEADKNTYRGKDIIVQGSHHNSNTLAHARLSLHVDLKEYNDAIYKQRSDFAEDNLENAFLLIGELQSDMLQKVGQRGQRPTKDRLPINKDKDYLRNLLQSIFIYAKNNNINSIVLPPVKKLREKRVRDLRTTSKDAGQKMFDMTYNKAFRKALKSLQDEYPKGTIKTREKKLKFMDGPSKDTISDREFYMAIHDIEDPDVLRSLNLRDRAADDDYYAQHREEYAQQAFDNYAVLDEDILTETGLEIDISNLLIGNTVPRLNKGGLIKKPGLMQRPS
jgi:hypothetical protein